MDERGPLGELAGPWNGGRQMIRHRPAAPTTMEGGEEEKGRKEGREGKGREGKGPFNPSRSKGREGV